MLFDLMSLHISQVLWLKVLIVGVRRDVHGDGRLRWMRVTSVVALERIQSSGCLVVRLWLLAYCCNLADEKHIIRVLGKLVTIIDWSLK